MLIKTVFYPQFSLVLGNFIPPPLPWQLLPMIFIRPKMKNGWLVWYY
nr:unnamed protein product [Callosobruchus chinensis]